MKVVGLLFADKGMDCFRFRPVFSDSVPTCPVAAGILSCPKLMLSQSAPKPFKLNDEVVQNGDETVRVELSPYRNCARKHWTTCLTREHIISA